MRDTVSSRGRRGPAPSTRRSRLAATRTRRMSTVPGSTPQTRVSSASLVVILFGVLASVVSSENSSGGQLTTSPPIDRDVGVEIDDDVANRQYRRGRPGRAGPQGGADVGEQQSNGHVCPHDADRAGVEQLDRERIVGRRFGGDDGDDRSAGRVVHVAAQPDRVEVSARRIDEHHVGTGNIELLGHRPTDTHIGDSVWRRGQRNGDRRHRHSARADDTDIMTRLQPGAGTDRRMGARSHGWAVP